MNIKHAVNNHLRQDPREPGFVQNPYALYRQLQVTGAPVFWEDYGFWCVPSFAGVNSILRDKRFARLPPPGHEQPAMPPHLTDFAAAEKFSLLSLEPPAHTQLRKCVNRAFASRQVNKMAPGIRKLAHHRIDLMEANGPCDLLSQYATPIAVELITRLLGVPRQAGSQLIEWSHAMVRVYTLTQSHDEEIAANQAAKEFQQFLQAVIQKKRQHPGDDLLSHLLTTAADEEPLSDQEVISVSILLLNAGHEATVHQLGNAVNTLLQTYPADARDTLQTLLANDLSCDALVAECLRFSAPLHMFMRYAQQTLSLADGVQIEPGEQIGVLLAAANRCPRRFTNPDSFNPMRTDAGHVSLGAGLHFCVGAQLAKLELRIALQVLFERLPRLELDEQPVYQDAYHFHGLRRLLVSWIN